MVKVVVFDLDDTLYDEMSYVFCGLERAALFLSKTLHEDPQAIFQELKKLVLVKREHVFNRFLQKRGLFTKKRLLECIRAYRSHNPKITLYPSAKRCLEALVKEYPLYLVTDGNLIVQRKKVQALKVHRFMKRVFCTHQYGVIHAKPSPYCFTKILSLEKVRPCDVVYIADNPRKDFVKLKSLGFHTVRVLTGQHKDVYIDEAHEAEYQIQNLNLLTKSFLQCLKP